MKSILQSESGVCHSIKYHCYQSFTKCLQTNGQLHITTLIFYFGFISRLNNKFCLIESKVADTLLSENEISKPPNQVLSLGMTFNSYLLTPCFTFSNSLKNSIHPISVKSKYFSELRVSKNFSFMIF
jgi:hypothetical protein